MANQFGKAWYRCYVSGRNVRYSRALFRSLEIAYHAASVRFKNYGSIHEAGLGAALWVSAIEILASPPQITQNVTRLHAIDLIGEYEWRDSKLRQRRNRIVLKWKNGKVEKTRNVNLAQKAYDLLYTARSKFLHGDHISEKLLLPFAASKHPLLGIAPTIYRAAVGAYLNRELPERHDLDPITFRSSLAQHDYGRHLSSAIRKTR